MLRSQGNLRFLSTLIATAMTAALPGACGSNGGAPGDAGSSGETGSDDSGGADGSSAGSGSSSGIEASSEAADDSTISDGSSSGTDSSSSASGSSSGGNCPPGNSYTVDPTRCEPQLTYEQPNWCWNFEQPCFGEGGSVDAGDPCAVCTTMVDGSLAGPVDASVQCSTQVTANGRGIMIYCGGCCVGGRAPRGFVPVRAQARSQRAARLADMAQLEAASVPAFRALHADLARLRAPRRILSAVRAAARDEVRHARAVGRAAERFGARVPRARVAPTAPRTLEQLAIENAEEGCVRETFGAAIAAVQAERATDGAVRCIMRVIAREELRHAALAWDIAGWLDAKLDGAARARVRDAREAALERLLTELASLGAGDPVLGLPDARSSGALLECIRKPLACGLHAFRHSRLS